MSQPTPRNVDEDFAEAMRPIGGVRPVELNAHATDRSNADIVLPDQGVILEVKTLMDDSAGRPEHAEKVQKIYETCAGRPGVPMAWGRVKLDTTQVPEAMAVELLRTLAGPIRGAVKSANKQIRILKETLGMPNAHGVLVLCNSGATTLTPHYVLNALHHALGKQHSSINSAIYFTDGVPIQLPDTLRPTEFFSTLVRENGSRLPDGLGNRIRDAWLKYRAKTQGVVTAFRRTDFEAIFTSTNVPMSDRRGG